MKRASSAAGSGTAPPKAYGICIVWSIWPPPPLLLLLLLLLLLSTTG
jgi:hypothetical protein